MAQIEIGQEAVNQLVANAILDSALGAHLRKMVEDHLKELHSSYKNPIKAALEAETHKVVQDMVSVEFLPKIQEIVREKMTEEVIANCANAAWEALINSIKRNR